MAEEKNLPEPLVPAEVDLRGYEFMPFYGDRAFGSESWVEGSHEARVAMLKLWWRAYAKERPAASLPDKDALLREYAGYAEAPRAWQKVREQALRGFVKCSDGRLYHKVISVLAVEAWEFRNKQRNRTEAARLARFSQRLSQTEEVPPEPSVTDSTGQDRTRQDSNPLPTSPEVGVPDGTTRPPVPDCPHERIIELYHEVMPLNPKVLEWTETRRGHLRARWREKALPNGRTQGYASVDAGLTFWRRFFTYCGESKFLTGQAEPKPGKRPFCPNLDWLLKPENFAKVLEGNYHG